MHANVVMTVTVVHSAMNFLTGLQKNKSIVRSYYRVEYPSNGWQLYFPGSNMCFEHNVQSRSLGFRWTLTRSTKWSAVKHRYIIVCVYSMDCVGVGEVSCMQSANIGWKPYELKTGLKDIHPHVRIHMLSRPFPYTMYLCVCVCVILYESCFELVNANIAVFRSYILKCRGLFILAEENVHVGWYCISLRFRKSRVIQTWS
jgi:hypothetical protein